MKTFIIVLSVLFLASCAVGPSVVQEPQRVIIEVISGTDQKVAVTDGEDKIHRSMEVKNIEGELSNVTFVSDDKAFVKIYSGLSVADVTRLWSDLIYLENNTKIKDIALFINSGGGDAFSGLALACLLYTSPSPRDRS